MKEKPDFPNSNHLDKAVPWQLRFAVFFGVPALICVYLVYWLTTSLDLKLNQAITNQTIILKEFIDIKTQLYVISKNQEDLRTRQDRAILALREICVNGIEPGHDTSRCFQ